MIATTLVGDPATLQHHHVLSAQCPSCGLDELIPIHLQKRADGHWARVDQKGLWRGTRGDASQADVQVDTCPVCFGAWFDPGELDTLSGDVRTVEGLLDNAPRPTARKCPHGHGSMEEHRLPGRVATPIDRCSTCGGIWLDGHERRKLAKATTREGQGSRAERMLRRGAIWIAQAITHVPVEVDNPARGTPWVVFSLLSVLLVSFVAQQMGYVDAYDLGIVPGRLRQQHDAYTIAAHIFLHGSWPHLLGNAYFLYTFGDNVEHVFGHIRFAVFFVLAGALAGIIHFLLTHKTATPIVGASGAISGVLAAYLWAFPHQRLFQVILWIQLKIPVWIYLVAWVGFHIVMGLFGTGAGAEGVAWFAHLGGFAVGFVCTPWMLRLRRREVAGRVAVPAAAR
jgi:membrane associated rhomboid family serine protease